MKKHITLSLEEESIKKIKKLAIEKNTNVSQMIDEWVQEARSSIKLTNSRPILPKITKPTEGKEE